MFAVIKKKDYSDFFRFVIVIALIFGSVLINRSCTMDSAQTTGKHIGVLEQTNAQLVQDNKDSIITLEISSQVNDAQIDAIAKVNSYEKEVSVKTKKRIEVSVQKVKVLEVDNTLTDIEKDVKIAEVQIDSLWDAYCDVPGTVCKNTA